MIKIRYRGPNELSPGLHAAAERHGRSTTVYLLPGLSAAERRSALRRLRMASRRGYGPRLPALQMALAHLGDRIRTTAVQAAAVLRLHPAGSTVPVMLLSAGAIAFLAVSAVSIRIGDHEDSSPLIAAIAAPGPGGSPRPAGAIPADQERRSPGRHGSVGGAFRQAYVGSGSPGDPEGSGSPSPKPGGTPTGAAPSPSPTPTPSPPPSPTPRPPSSPSHSVKHGPAAGSGGGMVCVTIGELQFCL